MCLLLIYHSSVYLSTYTFISIYIWGYWRATKIVRIWRVMILKRNAMHKAKPYIWHSFSTQSLCCYVRLKSSAESCSWMTDKLSRTSDWLIGLGEQKLKFGPYQRKDLWWTLRLFLEILFLERLYPRRRNEMEKEKFS